MEEIYLLYGSQSGNAESIAKDMADILRNLCKDAAVSIQCTTLNAAKAEKFELKGSNKILLIVCSTTGNGDSPENSEAWWRTVKLRSAPKDLFAQTLYSVLGLGDTNYDKFCYMGKHIDKRLSELGGSRCIDIHCADEATNMEEVIEAWKTAVITLIKKQLSDKLTAESKSIEVAEEISPQSVCSPADAVAQPQVQCDAAIPSHPPQYSAIQERLSPSLLNIAKVADLFGIADKIKEPVDEASLPKQKTFDNGSLYSFDSRPAGPHREPLKHDSTDSEREFSSENPLLLQVKTARFLTAKKSNDPCPSASQWDSDRKVIHVDLVAPRCLLPYQPGDSIGVCCPNPTFLVNLVLKRLQKAHHDMPSLSLDTTVTTANSKELVTLGELLSYRFDLCSVPKKAAVLKLAQSCSDPSEAQQLRHLCSKSDAGKLLWAQFMEAQRVGMGELICLLESCCPTVSELLGCLSLQIPRYYSVASSPLATPGQVSFAFSVVHYSCGVNLPSSSGDEYKIRRYGVCTSYLEDALSPWLSADEPTLNGQKDERYLRVFHKPTISFRLPGSVSHPLILVGPGTGVAPFVGFLKHREHLECERRQRAGQQMCTGMWRGGFELDECDLPCEGNVVETFINSIAPGPVRLYFGCRNEEDYLYKEELEGFLKSHTLTDLRVAMSRVRSEKEYVTHHLLEDKETIARLILKEGGYVYVCGDGNRMAKDVSDALRDIVADFGFNGDVNEAAAYMKEMRIRQRYLQDIWS